MCNFFWFHPYLWSSLFFLWYQIYVTSFLSQTIYCDWYLILVLCFFFVSIWSLSLTTLFKCLYTRPPLIHAKYVVPFDTTNVLLPEDAEKFRKSEISLKALLKEILHDNTERKEKWLIFYHKVADLAIERKLEVRKIRLTFGTETALCPMICTSCMIFKPLRTHHCTRCGKCIVRMDHHCPALGKCINLTNHKFFLIFLVYSSLLGLYAFVTILPLLILAINQVGYKFKSVKDYPTVVVTPFAICAVGCSISFVFSFMIAFFQLSFWDNLIRRNQTVVENIQERTAASQQANYNKGSKMNNVESIFGKNKWLWFVPVNTTSIEF